MPIELVEIVNPNGRKGRVAATSPAAKAYKRSPSTRDTATRQEPVYPTGAPVEAWTARQLTAYAADHGIDLTPLGARPKKPKLLAAVLAGPTGPIDPTAGGTPTPESPSTPTTDDGAGSPAGTGVDINESQED